MENGPRLFRGSIVLDSTSQPLTLDECLSECVKYEECLAFNFDANTSSGRNCYIFQYSDVTVSDQRLSNLFAQSTYKTYVLKRSSFGTKNEINIWKIFFIFVIIFFLLTKLF